MSEHFDNKFGSERSAKRPLNRNNSSDNNSEFNNGVNEYQKAVALKYDGQTAPRVTASGSGQLADEIIALARELGIPLYENPELTEMLAMLDLGDEIPHELYLIIAQIIALAYNIKAKDPSA